MTVAHTSNSVFSKPSTSKKPGFLKFAGKLDL